MLSFIFVVIPNVVMEIKVRTDFGREEKAKLFMIDRKQNLTPSKTFVFGFRIANVFIKVISC